MAMHVIIAGTAGSAAGAAGMIASASAQHATMIVDLSSVVSTIAACVGATIALVSFIRHRSSNEALERHEIHDDERFDRIEQLLSKSD